MEAEGGGWIRVRPRGSGEEEEKGEEEVWRGWREGMGREGTGEPSSADAMEGDEWGREGSGGRPSGRRVREGDRG